MQYRTLTLRRVRHAGGEVAELVHNHIKSDLRVVLTVWR